MCTLHSGMLSRGWDVLRCALGPHAQVHLHS